MSSQFLRKRGRAGLTLLEVLAAVLIFSMVMTVLIGTSTNAVHHVGVSSRRLEADLFADNLLSDLEIQIKQGTAPAIEDGEFTNEPFSIRMTMTEIVSDDPNAPSAPGEFATGVAANASGDIVSLLRSSLPEVAGHLKQYDIEVSWLEQNVPQSITRTTFAFDWEAAQVELAALVEDASQNDISGLGGDGTSPQANSSGGAGSGRRPSTNPLGGSRPFNGRNAGEAQRRAISERNSR